MKGSLIPFQNETGSLLESLEIQKGASSRHVTTLKHVRTKRSSPTWNLCCKLKATDCIAYDASSFDEGCADDSYCTPRKGMPEAKLWYLALLYRRNPEKWYEPYSPELRPWFPVDVQTHQNMNWNDMKWKRMCFPKGSSCRYCHELQTYAQPKKLQNSSGPYVSCPCGTSLSCMHFNHSGKQRTTRQTCVSSGGTAIRGIALIPYDIHESIRRLVVNRLDFKKTWRVTQSWSL